MEAVKPAQIEPGICLLTMDREASLNALSRQLLADMRQPHRISSKPCESAVQ